VARTAKDPDKKSRALAELAQAVAISGDPDRARRLLNDAETVARTAKNPDKKFRALAELAQAVAATGDLDRAEELIRTIPRSVHRDQAFAEVVSAVAASGDTRRAETLTCTITNPHSQAFIWENLARSDTASPSRRPLFEILRLRGWSLSAATLALAGQETLSAIVYELDLIRSQDIRT
jgi:hypothetical protein